MAQFERLAVYNTVLKEGLVPLFYQSDFEIARRVVAALAEGGVRLVEFTNRGDHAIEVFSELVRHALRNHPELILGAGSIDDAPTAALFIAHGANFIVGPTLNPEVARLCNRRKIAYMPGCSTVTEIAQAEELGVEIVKYFPGSLGGPEFVKAVLGPRPWTRIMPTGGVSADEDNLRAWFSAGVACVGMGSNLVRSDWVKAHDYAAIAAATRAALDLIARVRGG